MTEIARIVLLAGLANLCVGCAGVGAAAEEEADPAVRVASRPLNEVCDPSSEAQYLDCDEFAGVGVVPFANVVNRVPAGYTVIEAWPGAAVVVAQAARCAEINVGGASRAPGVFAQFGVSVAPPTGAGDGNFYQLMFVTTHPCLASQLQRIGVDARVDPGLAYSISAAPALSVTAPSPPLLAWGLSGPITLPDPASAPNPVTTFNYWRKTAQNGNVLQQNVVTGIRFGEGSGVTMTAIGTEMQAIVGGSTLTFPFFSKPETFDQADVSFSTNVFP